MSLKNNIIHISYLFIIAIIIVCFTQKPYAEADDELLISVYINDTIVNENDVFFVRFDREFHIKYSLSGKNISDFKIIYPSYLEAYGIDEKTASFLSGIDTDDDNQELAEITYELIPKSYFIGYTVIKSFPIKIVSPDNDQEIIVNLPEIKIQVGYCSKPEYITSYMPILLKFFAGIYKKKTRIKIPIIIVCAVLAGLILAVFSIKYYQKQKLIKSTSKESKLNELIFYDYVLLKDSAAKKSLKEVVKLLEEFLLKFIKLKYNLSDISEFYQISDIDDNIKSEIKRFLRVCKDIKYIPGEPEKQAVEKLENDFKTFLFML